MLFWVLGACLASARRIVLHEADSPAVGHFPGRRLAAVGEERRLQAVPMFGSLNDFAYYFVDVLVGTPPQRQSVILDSGSSLLGFPCTSCGRHCGRHLDQPFDISKSSTAEHYSCQDHRCVNRGGTCSVTQGDTCLYSQVYSEGSSIEGYFFSDKIALGDTEDKNTFVKYDYIGCHSKETVLFTTQQANGILGVSFPKGGRQPTVMDTLMGSHAVNAKVFSLCAAEDGGLLTVGGYNETFHKASFSRASNLQGLSWLSNFLRGSAAQRPIAGLLPYNRAGSSASSATTTSQSKDLSKDVVWIKIQSDSAYAISISRISLMGHTVANGGFSEVLVDSGTTYSYFPNDVYHAIEKELLDLCTYNNQLPPEQQAGTCVRGKADIVCFNFPNDDKPAAEYLKRIPSFFVELGNGGIVEWAAESWLFRKTERVWCSAVENNRRRQTILGMSFMKMKNVIFDRDNSYIGFVSADCPAHQVDHRPSPPSSQESRARDGPWIGQSDSSLNDSVSMMKPLPAEVYNDKMLWKWAGQQALPYFNSIEQDTHSATQTDSVIDHTTMSWAVGGAVGLAVVGGLMSLVARSISRNGEPFEPNEERRFPVFDELERGEEWLG